MLSNAITVSLVAIVISLITTAAWARAAYRVAIPNNRAAFLLLWALSVALGVTSFYSAGVTGVSQALGAVAALLGFSMLMLYSLGGQRAEHPILVGDSIPSFSALNGTGQQFDSASLSGSPVLLKFFRGHW
jgi:hypothetical protein